MRQEVPDRSNAKTASRVSAPAQATVASLEWLYGQANASRWGLSRADFAAALDRCAQKRLATGALPPAKLEEYLRSLHLEDLALATACLENCEPAWEHFVAAYRVYLRAAASAVLRCSSGSPAARDLADSLFAELYGLSDSKRGDRSLFRYFHGRSSLKTWLRAVLAQRHIDAIRAGRRFTELDARSDSDRGERVTSAHPDGHARIQSPPD